MEDKNEYRRLFNGIEVPVKLLSGEYVCPINFDNAATTPPLIKVDEFISENIMMYGSVGRGGHKSSYCTEAYEISKEEVLDFFSLKSDDGYEVIYVKNTTEGLNLLANLLCNHNHSKILTTRMEHHANDLPWRNVAQPFYIEVNKNTGSLELEQLESRLKKAQGTIQYVTITGASNVTGYITPIHEIAKVVHQYGAKLIVDAAQLVAHRAINIKGNAKEEAIDFLVFSGHKMYAPFGSGVVIARKDILEQCPPFLRGGGSVSFVLDHDVYYKSTPYKDEAGTPNFLGVMSIVAAITVLRKIGFDAIQKHEDSLRKRLISGLKQIDKVILYGDDLEEERVGVVPFNIRGIHQELVGRWLQDERGIAVRTGCFCAQPYVMRLLDIEDENRYDYLINPKLEKPGMIRASFGLYNTEDEVDEFLNVIEKLVKRH